MFEPRHVRLWVDDLRPAPEGYEWVKTTNEAIMRIFWSQLHSQPNCAACDKKEKCESGEYVIFCDKHDGPSMVIDVLDLDHDAGDYAEDGGDYIKILDFMEQEGINDIPIHLHTMNPVGRENMRRIIRHNGWREI